MPTDSPPPLPAESAPAAAPAPDLSTPHAAGPVPLPRWGRRKRLVVLVTALLLAYVAAAYLLLPWLWRVYAHRHPSLADVPGITHTRAGIPGDPINVALIGTRAEVIKAMLAAKWHPADPITLRSSLRIALDSVLKRPDEQAPVSNLYLFGRKQDLAFQEPVGGSPRQRHHVRFWLSDKVDADGRPVWVGSVTFDRRVGFSHRTGQVTHHIAADVDAERDHLMHCLEQTGDLEEVYAEPDFHQTRAGRNGGGDRWSTDGTLDVAVIRPTP